VKRGSFIIGLFLILTVSIIMVSSCTKDNPAEPGGAVLDTLFFDDFVSEETSYDWEYESVITPSNSGEARGTISDGDMTLSVSTYNQDYPDNQMCKITALYNCDLYFSEYTSVTFYFTSFIECCGYDYYGLAPFYLRVDLTPGDDWYYSDTPEDDTGWLDCFTLYSSERSIDLTGQNFLESISFTLYTHAHGYHCLSGIFIINEVLITGVR